jgi:RNA polymerase primary sigma factor
MRQLKITKSITNRDSESFSKYLAEVSKIGNVISPEEEIELARKIKNGDEKAAEKLIKANLKFVVSVAKQYSGKAPLPDLIQEGNLGMIKAAQRFDETRGFKFISYAVWWIRQSILQSIADDGRMIRLPLNKIGNLNKINASISELNQHLERQPTEEEISDYLIEQEMNKGFHTSGPNKGMSKGDPSRFTTDRIKYAMSEGHKMGALDSPMTNESDSGTMVDLIKGDSEHDINKVLKNSDLQIELKRVMQRLTYRERDVLILYFGLFGTSPISLEEIGQRYELTRERVRQIKEKGVRKLKNRLAQNTLKEYVH